jgi:hypothetical protein
MTQNYPGKKGLAEIFDERDILIAEAGKYIW